MAEKMLIRGCIYLAIAIAMLVLSAFSAYSSEDLPFDEYYYDNFKEGKSMVVTLGELDMLTFTFYGTNYTSRIMSIHVQSIDIRVGMKGREIGMDTLVRFDIDDEEGYDLNVTLSDISADDVATLRFSLEKKPEIDDEDNITNTTNTTNSASDTNDTDDSDSSDDNSSSQDDSSASSNNDDSSNDGDESQDDGDEAGEDEKGNKATGDTIVINFNITLSEGGIVGLLIIVAIVLIGMVTYMKVKKKQETTGGSRKKTKSGKPVKRKPFLKTTYRNMKPKLRKMKKGFNVARVKVAELIGGGKIVKEETPKPLKYPNIPKYPKIPKYPEIPKSPKLPKSPKPPKNPIPPKNPKN